MVPHIMPLYSLMLDWHNLFNQIDTPPAACLAELELQNHRILQID